MSGLRTLLSFVVGFARSDRSYRAAVALVVATGVLSGLASTSLMAVINAALHAPHAPRRALGAAFAALCVLLPAARFSSNFLLIRLGQSATRDLRLHLSRRILGAPLRQLEQMGAHRLLAVLTEDVNNITAALGNIPLLVMQLTVVAGCLLYLGWLSWSLLSLVLLFVVAGSASYRLLAAHADRYFRSGRELWDRMFRCFQGLTLGTKELKLHRPRREAFLAGQLAATAASLCDANVRASAIFAGAQSWGQVLFFLLIGLLLFVLQPARTGGAEVLGGFILAILYMLTPFDVVMNALPWIGRASVSVRKIAELEAGLGAEAPAGSSSPVAPEREPWARLELAAVTHTYHHERDDDRFTLGPLDLSFRPGELIFVVGGNGSGKTTFAKLLLGLYWPESGEIRIDGQALTEATVEQHRQAFSAVFADFHLFEELIGLAGPGLDDKARDYLRRLMLDRKVKVDAGALSTLDLSQGQRKRLALLTAYLEDRPIYVFDEWAADQDPQFKETFYLQLLPELKARRKTVFVISHDDRYYSVADRVLKLNCGQVEFDGRAADYLLSVAV
jgi:putative ATP-binding cassette transporter